MLSYQVKRNTKIAMPLKDVLAYLSDLSKWPQWSPWLIVQPDCKIEYSGTLGQTGSSYAWQGDLVGAGSMLLDTISNNGLELSLSFEKPFKSKAQISFELVENGNDKSTLVTWKMDSKLPWFLFFLTGMMKAWIGMDFDRGLLMLKNKLETGRINSKLDIKGIRSEEDIHYIAVAGKALLKDLPEQWQSAITQLKDYFDKNGIEISGPVFGLYHKMDMKTTLNDFQVCFPVHEKIEVEAPLLCATIPGGKRYVVEHIGEYHYLGNGWAGAMNSSRYQKVKVKRPPMGMERYLNDPHQTKPEDLKTEIILFVK